MTHCDVRSYRELIRLKTFEDRYEYLRFSSRIGDTTFGFDRYLNQSFYRSKEWIKARRDAIARDLGCDLSCPDRPIFGRIEVHHINPISAEDVETGSPMLICLDNLITISPATHKLVHYGINESDPIGGRIVIRTPNDTSPWLT